MVLLTASFSGVPGCWLPPSPVLLPSPSLELPFPFPPPFSGGAGIVSELFSGAHPFNAMEESKKGIAQRNVASFFINAKKII
jgi:hypothetical protein